MAVNDDKLLALRTLTSTTAFADISDLEYKWLATQVTAAPIPDMWRAFLISKGVTAGSLPDMFYAWYGTLGYTGGLSDRQIAYWKAGGGTGAAFNFNPATARKIFSGDSITALDDDTGFLYWASALAGGPLYMPPYMHQGVSGAEINEGVIATNIKDLLYPTRKQLLIDATQSGDVVNIAIGTNSITDQSAQTTIDGLTELYGQELIKGALIVANTILPSASNAGAALNTVNAWINALETTGLTHLSVFYPGTRFLVVDGYTAWGGTYVGRTDSGNLHPNTLGAMLIGRAFRTKLKAIGRAYCPLMYGITNPSDNLLSNWALTGSGGTATAGGSGSTPTNNGTPTGVAIVNNIGGIAVTVDTVASYHPNDSLYSAVANFPVVKVTVTGTSSEATDKDITITMAQTITSEAAGSAYESSIYAKWKGTGATVDPTGLFAFGFGYGSVTLWGSQNSSKLTNFTNVTLGDEGVLRGRSKPTVQAFGSSSIILTIRVLAGAATDFEFYFGQPYAAKRERTAYGMPKSLHTDQNSIGGVRATGPQVGASNTSWTNVDGVANTGRPGLAWFGGGHTYQFTWERLRSAATTIVAGPTTVTTTASTTQATIAGSITGDQYRLKVTATNSFGSADAYSVYSAAMP